MVDFWKSFSDDLQSIGGGVEWGGGVLSFIRCFEFSNEFAQTRNMLSMDSSSFLWNNLYSYTRRLTNVCLTLSVPSYVTSNLSHISFSVSSFDFFFIFLTTNSIIQHILWLEVYSNNVYRCSLAYLVVLLSSFLSSVFVSVLVGRIRVSSLMNIQTFTS